VVKVRLSAGNYYEDWGFRIDRVADGEPQRALAESPHYYYPNQQLSWTLVNPNPAAAFSKVHFSRLDLAGGDSLVLYDGSDIRVQTLGENTHLTDFWSDDVPGRVVKVRLSAGNYYEDWGFRIDDVAPKVEEVPIPAFVDAVYVYVGQPGDLWLNGVYIGRASVPGDYRIQLPEIGEHLITVETLFHKQEIVVRTSKDGTVQVEYSGIEPRSEEGSE
jgi:hypothetical protein